MSRYNDITLSPGHTLYGACRDALGSYVDRVLVCTGHLKVLSDTAS